MFRGLMPLTTSLSYISGALAYIIGVAAEWVDMLDVFLVLA